MTAHCIPRNGDSLPDMKSPIRRFVAEDVPQVADVHRRIFGIADASPALMESHRAFFSDVFLNPARQTDSIGSLVYEEGPGDVVGFQGVMPRRMIFENRPIVMAVLSHLSMDPARRGGRGIRLLQHCLNGPQDLTFTDESNDVARKIWEWCGGRTALLYSMRWVRPLRPSQTVLQLLMQRRSPRLARIAAPFAWMIDKLAAGHGLLRLTRPAGSRHELEEPVMAERLSEFTAGRSLRPDYTDGSLSWILQQASTREGGGPLRKVLVRDDDQEIAGWYLYYANRGGVAEVLQVAGRKGAIGQVLDHLIEDASESGAIALAGRFDPGYAQELSDRYCLFYRRGNWTLIHSRRPELLEAIERGDAFLSRLEGEWCLHLK